jgi:uncharacterized protein YkwD
MRSIVLIHWSRWLLPAAVVAVVAAASPAQSPQQKPAAVRVSPEQLRKVSRVMTHFRQAGKDDAKRQAVVREAIVVGTPAVAALKDRLWRELAPELKHYLVKFKPEAVRYVRDRVAKTDLEEVARLREKVLDLQKQPKFTHEAIVAKADPAMKRLEKMLVFHSSDVLKCSKNLQAERERLVPLGNLWEWCAAALYNETAPANRPKTLPSFVKYLESEEDAAVSEAAPIDPVTRAILDTNAQLARQIDSEEARCILAVNRTRNLLGLSALVIDLQLCATARDHSKDMKEKNFFSHESPVEGKKTPWDRAKRYGTSASGENIFAGSADGEAANSAWFHSPGHHANMLGGHKRIGVGRCEGHFTEMFGG